MGTRKKQQDETDLDPFLNLLDKKEQNMVEIKCLSQISDKKFIDDKFIILSQDLEPAQVIKTFLKYGVKHLVQEKGFLKEEEIKRSAKIISDPKFFIQNPLSVFQDTSCSKITEVLSTSIKSSQDKDKTLSQLRQQLETCSQSLSSKILMVADELISNALKASLPVTKTSSNAVHFSVFSNEDYLALLCKDFQGSLDLEKYFSNILSCYEDGISKNMNFEVHKSAGIGSFFIFDYSTIKYVLVKEKSITLFACLFPKNMSNVKRESLA
ncbi:MAG: hypothetical protein D6797_07875, partial [Bdellovibrio sp.]